MKLGHRLFGVVMIGCMVFFVFISYRDYVAGEEAFTKSNVKFEYQENSGANFYIDGDNIFFSTKDGIQYVNDKGKLLWKEIFDLTYPIMLGEGNCVLVTENRGDTIYVFNSEGKLYEKKLPNPVINVSMNSNGYAAVTMEDDTGYRIVVYDNTGKQIRVVPSYIYNVFPISTDISDDNKTFAVSYYSVTELKPGAWISYFNIDQWDAVSEGDENGNSEVQDKLGSEVNPASSASIEKERMIPIIKFMKDNYLIAVADKEIIFFKAGEKFVFTEVNRIELKNEIGHIYFTDDYNVTVALGNPILNGESDPIGTVRTYDLDGNIIFETNMEKEVTHISADFNSLIIGSDSVFTAYTNEGKFLWQYNAMQTANKLLFYNNTRTVLDIGSAGADILKLAKINSDESEEIVDTNLEPSEISDIPEELEDTVEADIDLSDSLNE